MKTLSIALSSLVLWGCGSTAPQPPEFIKCALIWNGTVIDSYGFCLSTTNSETKVRMPLETIIQEGWLTISPTEYGKAEKYLEDIKQWGANKCK